MVCLPAEPTVLCCAVLCLDVLSPPPTDRHEKLEQWQKSQEAEIPTYYDSEKYSSAVIHYYWENNLFQKKNYFESLANHLCTGLWERRRRRKVSKLCLKFDAHAVSISLPVRSRLGLSSHFILAWFVHCYLPPRRPSIPSIGNKKCSVPSGKNAL